MKMNKPQYTKMVVTITTILFIVTLFSCLWYMFYITFSGLGETVDYIVATTALSVMGGIYGMVLRSYMSKSGLENVATIRKSVYKEIMNTRLEYDEKVLILKKKYEIDQNEFDEIEDEAPFKEMSEAVLSQTISKIDDVDSLNESEPTEC